MDDKVIQVSWWLFREKMALIHKISTESCKTDDYMVVKVAQDFQIATS